MVVGKENCKRYDVLSQVSRPASPDLPLAKDLQALLANREAIWTS